MGWKSVRDHYRIDHDVQVVPDKGICIGSAYVHDLIVILPDGSLQLSSIVRREEGGKLGGYITALEADRDKLVALMEQPDTFERSIPVFTYEGGEIIEKQCEELGYPNVTHDGAMQYENTFSPDAALVRAWAIKSAKAGIEWMTESLAEAVKEVETRKARLDQRWKDLLQLEAGNCRAEGREA